MSYGMGKFDDAETEAAYEIVMEGGGSESIGDVETTNAYDLVEGPFDKAPLKGYAGIILEHTNQGFVHGELFKSKKALDKKWKANRWCCSTRTIPSGRPSRSRSRKRALKETTTSHGPEPVRRPDRPQLRPR